MVGEISSHPAHHTSAPSAGSKWPMLHQKSIGIGESMGKHRDRVRPNTAEGQRVRNRLNGFVKPFKQLCKTL